MIFWREKEKKTASRFEAKNAAMRDEGLLSPESCLTICFIY
jgi:hypothetical protein